MTNRSTRTAARSAFILSFLLVPAGALWAQNENETTGFQSNHIFESGQFGEDIDVLNGGLHLTTPIGPKYQVNDRLSYQLVLHYNSKIWEYIDYAATNGNSIKLIHEGPMGLGFTLSFGRLLQDVHNTPAGYERTWKWVTPDGNQHDVWYAKELPTTPVDYPQKTGDTSYILVNNNGCAPGMPGPCTVSTTDGLTYTLSWHVEYPESTDQNVRADNVSFGGWYVTRIEDRSIGFPDVANSFGTTGPVTGLFPNHVVIAYDTRANFEHVIKEIRDNQGRVITFKNCRYTSSTTCVDDAIGAADRSQVATEQIDLPGFSVNNANAGLETIDSSEAAKAIYKFTYVYGDVNRYHPAPGGMTVTPAGPTLQLKRLDYPEYVHRGGTRETYSLYFDYGNYAELTCRTLPLRLDASKSCGDWQGLSPSFTGAETIFTYEYDKYLYLPRHLSESSDGIHLVEDGTPTRQVVAKRILVPGTTGPTTHTWSYVRDMSQGTTNPWRVTVTDAVGNDTVYYYHASYMPANDNPDAQVGALPDDGLAPEWSDGLNYRIEYYRGNRTGGVLVRSENREYETDTRFDGSVLQKTKENSRVQRTATVFNDDGGTESVVSNSGWDGFGNWRTVSEAGFGVPGVRNTHTDYYTLRTGDVGIGALVWLTGLSHYKETHDGYRVLERVDNFYNAVNNAGDGRLETTITRKTLPATLGSQKQPSFLKGDVKTTYDYSDSTRLLESKLIASGGGGAAADYHIDYTWLLGAYLKSKTFRCIVTDGPCTAGTALPWKTIDRKRDGNTGLIYSVKDPAGFETKYLYDALGRLTDIKPPNLEFPTAIDYVSLKETTVTRNPESTTDFIFSRYAYDGLGRLVREERRPADPSCGYPYQTSAYDVLNRVVFKSEWLLPGAGSCNPSPVVGTTSDYGTPPDPFGRVKTITTADGKVTTMTYQGQDSTVTVEGVVGPGGVVGPITTKYFRDAWGQLIWVEAPNNGGADAGYVYDLRGNLTRVDLYDQANPLLKQTRFFEYDGLNKLFQTINPESNATVFSDYDGLGNARSITGADGVTLEYAYDTAGRLKTARRSGSAILLVENTYDAGTNAAGKISTSISRDDGGALVILKSFAYAGLNGRLSTLSQTFGGVSSAFPVTYGYDNYGNVNALTYPEGPPGKGGYLRVDPTYANGTAVSVQESGTGLGLASVTYNPAGGIQTLTTPQSMKTEIAADVRNRPLRITIGRGTYNPDPAVDSFSDRTDYQSGTYRYDGAGNIYEMERANGLMNVSVRPTTRHGRVEAGTDSCCEEGCGKSVTVQAATASADWPGSSSAIRACFQPEASFSRMSRSQAHGSMPRSRQVPSTV